MESSQSEYLLYKDCISKQLEEIDLLSSIYCNPDEMHIFDPGVISDFNEYLQGAITTLPAHLDFTITVTTNSGDKIEIRVELPHLYPAIENAIFTFNSSLLSKFQKSNIKMETENYIASMEKNNTYIFQVISWIQDHIDSFLEKDTAELEFEQKSHTSATSEIVDFERLWIYSHHIKSKTKRQEIVRISRELNLSGFLRSGKPGIICVEGLKKNTQEFWKNIKCMTWHKITIRKSEIKQKEFNKIDQSRRFIGFHEALGSRNEYDEVTNISMGQFMAFLEQHNSGYMKKELFGFD